MENKSVKLWGCSERFGDDINEKLAKLNNSLPVDQRLYKEDIEGSIGYAQILSESKSITKSEFQQIESAFKKILEEWETGKIEFKLSDEDVHTANERRLTELIGDAGRKLHIGRSRNEQTVVDVKLWTKKAIKIVQAKIICLIKTITEIADKNIDVLMPGYTHMQQAQPIRLSHWILSYGFSLQADYRKLANLLENLDYCPLGSGAIAGNPFGIDRKRLAEILGFSHLTPNSMYAVSDRDFIVEFNFVCSMISGHLSRLAEDLIIYSTKEFNFIKISGQFSTGSSLMPQKFNPDSLELIRGSTGPIFGELFNMMVTVKGLPSTYNKDMQNDKKSIFNAFDSITDSLDVMNGVIGTMGINADNCQNALSYDMLATDLAYYLARKGTPFREAHHISTKVVHFAEKQKISISEVSLDDLRKICDKFEVDVKNCWNFENSVEQYNVIGGTSKSSVIQQIQELRKLFC